MFHSLVSLSAIRHRYIPLAPTLSFPTRRCHDTSTAQVLSPANWVNPTPHSRRNSPLRSQTNEATDNAMPRIHVFVPDAVSRGRSTTSFVDRERNQFRTRNNCCLKYCSHGHFIDRFFSCLGGPRVVVCVCVCGGGIYPWCLSHDACLSGMPWSCYWISKGHMCYIKRCCNQPVNDAKCPQVDWFDNNTYHQEPLKSPEVFNWIIKRHRYSYSQPWVTH